MLTYLFVGVIVTFITNLLYVITGTYNKVAEHQGYDGGDRNFMLGFVIGCMISILIWPLSTFGKVWDIVKFN